MLVQKFPWKRYWQKIGDQPLAPATGFLPEFSDEVSRLVFPEFRPLSDLEEVQCLVLLGEPGLGKTTAVEDEVERLKSVGSRVLAFDLKVYGDSSDVICGIFDNAEFDAIAEFPLTTVVMDSIDEGRLAVENIALIIAREIKQRLKDADFRSKVRLRITCRSAEMPGTLIDSLRATFGEENVEIWHLMQLRRSDVYAAALGSEVQAQQFMEELEAANAEPLAIKPVTLDLLLKLKAQSGALPSSKVELYRRGLKCLCTEANKHRRETGSEISVGRLSAVQRMSIARRIAGLSVLCQKPLIDLIERPGAIESGVLSPSDLLIQDDDRTSRSRGVVLEAKDVREVLKTGLFRTAGHERVTWMHRTYAEFLAAQYLSEARFSEEQLDDLLRSRADGDKRIVPQLHETVAWFASMNMTYQEQLVATDPDVLLRSDLLTFDDELKLRLASQIISAIEEKKVNELGLDRYLGGLCSGNLATVLLPWLGAISRDAFTVGAVLRIAKECRVQGMNAALCSIALDIKRPGHLRRLAIEALTEVATTKDKAELKSLLTDPDDELQVRVLKLLWPGTISTSEMLGSLRWPQDNMIGRHDLFIRRELADRLPDDDLPQALRWMAGFLEQNPHPSKPTVGRRNHNGEYNFRELFSALYGLAVDRAHIAEVAAGLAAAASALIKAQDWVWDTSRRSPSYRKVPTDIAVRRLVACQIISLLGDYTLGASSIAWHMPYIVSEDFDWLVGVLSREIDVKRRSLITDILFVIRDKDSRDHFEKLYNACDQHQDLQDRLDRLCGYIKLDSAEARYLQSEHHKDPAVEKKPRKVTEEQVRARVTKYLAGLERGQHELWWQFLTFLGWDDDRPSEAINQSGLQSLPRWNQVETSSQNLIAFARQYLALGDPYLDAWWPATSILNLPAWADYRALDHILEFDDDPVLQLSKETWAKWAPVIIHFHMNDEEEVGRGGKLSHICNRVAPLEYRARLREKLSGLLGSGNGAVSFRWHLKGTWDQEIGDLIGELVSGSMEKLQVLREGLELLLEHEHPAGSAMLRAAIAGSIQGEQRSAVLGVGIKLKRGDMWPEVWPLFEKDRALGIAVIEEATESSLLSEKGNLTDNQLADLYLLLYDLPKHDSDDIDDGDAFRELVWMRDKIPRVLSERATTSSCDALRKILHSHAELVWISHYIVECREGIRRASWQSPTPEQLFRLASDHDRRMVRSTTELIDVVGEAIQRFQKQLSGSPPAIGDVWNTCPASIVQKRKMKFRTSSRVFCVQISRTAEL